MSKFISNEVLADLPEIDGEYVLREIEAWKAELNVARVEDEIIFNTLDEVEGIILGC